MLDLKGKTALVTGGSRGIGAAIVREFSRIGTNIAFTYHSDKKSALAVAAAASREAECLMIKGGVTTQREVKKVIESTMNHFGRIDILVNNAGIWKRGEIGAMKEGQWDETLDVNLKGTFLFCNLVAPIMKKQRAGKIVNIASTAGQRGEAFYSHYAASKGGVIAFTKSISAELAPFNINANCVSPGWVDTDMTASIVRDKKKIKQINSLIPRGKIGKPQDIAHAVLFLASNRSDHIVGAVINVNGGGILFG
jgi:3-oxoacyl-[acyl-carrier protein] reductase